MFVCSTKTSNWLISRPLHWNTQHFHSPWETPFKLTVLNLHGRLPSGNWSFQDHFTQWILDSFQDPCIALYSAKSPWEATLRKLVLSGPFYNEFWIPFKTPVTHMSHSVNGLLSRPFGRAKEHRAHCSSFSGFSDSFQDPTLEIKEDTGQPDRSFIIIIITL